jgi:hypothetical protein
MINLVNPISIKVQKILAVSMDILKCLEEGYPLALGVQGERSILVIASGI